MTIAVTGSMAFDYIMGFSGQFTDYILSDQLENLSVSFLVNSMRRERGGIAGNIVYNLALLKQPTMLLASVGQDAGEYIQALDDLGVDVSAVLKLEDDFTASFFVSTDQNNRQIANFFIGAMAKASEVSLLEQKDKDISIVTICPNSPDAMIQYPQACKELGLNYMYDPSQQIPLIPPDDLIAAIDGAYILTANDYEFEIIKKRTNLSQDDLEAMVEVLIITRGEDGSTIQANGMKVDIPTIPNVQVVDPTGAGDAYRAGLLAGRQSGLDWLEAGRLATLAAAYALEEVGTQRHHYTIEAYAERYFGCFEHTAGVERFFNAINDT